MTNPVPDASPVSTQVPQIKGRGRLETRTLRGLLEEDCNLGVMRVHVLTVGMTVQMGGFLFPDFYP